MAMSTPDPLSMAMAKSVLPHDIGKVTISSDEKGSDFTEGEVILVTKDNDWFCYGVQQTDKTSLGTQAIFSLRTDTGLVGQQYSWLTTIFYIAYLSHVQQISLKLGVCVFSIAAAQDWADLMAIRALQCFFECTISPGFVLVAGTWYRTEEHSARALFWQSANAGFGIIANLVTYGIGSYAQKNDGIAPWRGISMVLGSCTVVLALICFALLGSPKEVIWLNKEEKWMAAARILRNKVGRDITGVEWTWSQVPDAFRDPQLWFCLFSAFLSSVLNGAFTKFASIMYNSFGFTQLEVLLIDIPRSVFSLLIFLGVGLNTRKVPNRRMYVMAAACIPPFVGLLGLAFLPNDPAYKWTKWGLYLITVPFVLALFLAWTLISSNVGGRTKAKTIIYSVTSIGYCVGNMVGFQICKAKKAPRYIPGTIGAAIFLGIEFALICTWRGYYVWMNRKRDKAAKESGVTPEEQEKLGREMGENNVTDLQNPHFRCTM
nr:hypothetical protein B0A51_04455 [Rachicladosporium sp. CCFEE 5018]